MRHFRTRSGTDGWLLRGACRRLVRPRLARAYDRPCRVDDDREVMHLVVVVALTIWVALEKLAPFGEQSARISGALLPVAAAWMFSR